MTEKFKINGMSCAACSASVERAVSRLDGVARAEVNLLGGFMLCEYDSGKLTAGKIISAVKAAGFSASLWRGEKAADTDEPRFTPVKTRLIVSVAFLLPLMYITMGVMFGLPLPHGFNALETPLLFALLQLLLTLPVAYVNRKFFYNGFGAMFRLAPNMDSLVALGSSAALAYGIYSVIMIAVSAGNSAGYASATYFESAAMILTLVTVGKLLEERSKSRTGDAISALVKLAPERATVLRGNTEVETEVSALQVGDLIVIRPGERVPVDGEVTEGTSSVNESALTGESVPVEKMPGSRVMAASINQSGAFVMRAEQVGDDTTLAKIIELVENAGATKAPVARMADRVAAVFVPTVTVIAIIAGAVWLICGAPFSQALSVLISVLVISCPCALGLATPVAVTVAAGRCASRGVMVKSAEAFELLAKCSTAVFDKTGTLTNGTPRVTDVITVGSTRDEELLRVAASLEQGSEHPLAAAVTEAARARGVSPESTEDFRTVAGRGIRAVLCGEVCLAGNAEHMAENGVTTAPVDGIAEEKSSEGKTLMYISRGGRLLGLITAADGERETSAEAIAQFHALGLDTVLLTGDNERCAGYIRNRLEITSAVANVLPQDKERIIAELQEKGNRVVMVGDGINDSPALTRADVGIAVGGGTDIAIDSADIVLMKNDVRDAAAAVGFARRTMRIIKENLFWAFFYNSIGIPIAAGVLYPGLGITLSPAIAAAAMSFSSIFVVLNSLRLYRDKSERRGIG